jgi:hypothetical protein
MGRFVIVAYKPREGKDAELLDLVREHVPILRGLGMVTERQPYIMRSKDGVIRVEGRGHPRTDAYKPCDPGDVGSI